MWSDALKATLYWYIAANDRGIGIGVDTGILLAQIALERLSWTYCVLDKGIAREKDFRPRGLSAAKKLRLLLHDLSIPAAIPPEFLTLQAGFKDGPEAITELRNSLVHPDKSRAFSPGSFAEAWRLSLWYLDLVLLRICGHTGNYANRCACRWVGEVEPVL